MNKVLSIMVVVLITLLILNIQTCKSFYNYKDLHNQVQDTLTTFKNKNGLMETYIKLIEADNNKTLLELQTRDSTINWLKEAVKKYKGKIKNTTVLSTITTSKDTLKNIIVIYNDTLVKDSLIYVYPEYSVRWINEFEDGTIVANKNEITRDIKVKNKYEIIMGKKNNGWFKKREQTVTVINLNPNTETKELRSFSIKEEPKKLNIGVQVGYGITKELLPTPYLGVGLNYTILSIK